jgi:hypothetical protein
MTRIVRDQTPEDFAWVAERLEQERPMASPLELDRMKVQARAQAGRGGRSQAKGSFLKSRVAIVAILVLGVLSGGTGTTLALSGGSEQGSAAQAQYPGGVKGQQEGSNGVLGRTESSPNSGTAVQGTQQVAATQGSNSNLPFTGLAALPLVLLGFGLLGAGGLLYRSSRQAPSEA